MSRTEIQELVAGNPDIVGGLTCSGAVCMRRGTTGSIGKCRGKENPYRSPSASGNSISSPSSGKTSEPAPELCHE